jgi:ergothioneine biosynthesis protein EgtB
MARQLSSEPQASDRIARDWRSVRAATEALAAPLSAEDCAVQSMPDASPTKWHLAHTSWFFETFVLAPHLPGYTTFDPAYRVLFNSYYDGVGDRHPRAARGLLSRPTLDDVRRYRRHVDAGMQALLGGRRLDADLRALVELGLHHEQQHQELILTDIKHAFATHPLRPAYAGTWPLARVAPQQPHWLPFARATAPIGHRDDGFCFDNETPAHEALIHPFELASHPVTFGEYLQFIEDGGYRQPQLWLSAGWDAVQANGWQAPAYCEQVDGRWRTVTLRGLVPIDRNTPVVHISYFEADAFARWAGARLPTEFEWERAARTLANVPPAAGANLLGADPAASALHPMPATTAVAPDRAAQLLGDVWEWTSSSYAPYPGFRPAPGAVGEYNGKFMCNQYVLRGGSCATPRDHIRISYRNFFPPEARWQFSGVRLARDAG